MAQRQPDQQGLANQGQPIGGPPEHSTGKKVTTDPASTQNPIRESAGPIASDSLAAESTRANGAFASNRNAAPQSVSGSASTFNNTDTSGAVTLDPASDAAEREAKAAWQDVPNEARGTALGSKRYPEGAGDVNFAGGHNKDGYAGGSREAQQEIGAGSGGYVASGIRGGAAPGGTGDVSNSAGIEAQAKADTGAAPGTGDVDDSAGTEAEAKPDTGAAPGYVSSVVSEPAKTGKPHGKNITEGIEGEEGKNVSFDAEIGSKDDPGRAATEQFQTKTQTSAGGKGARQDKVTGDGQYDALDTDQSL
ncbi:MAG: hypothetical protein Q9208_006863 [Pyrenodesmia sp. 3 TL-2023]